MFGGGGKSMDDMLFQLRFSSKQLDKLASKAEKDCDREKAKVKKAIEQKNVDAARIYAENSIRKHHESINWMRMSARIDAVRSRVQSAVAMKGVVKDIAYITKGLERAMSSMNLEDVEKVMSKFETQFENLDVQSSTLESTMDSAMATSAPTNQVDDLIKQIAEEAGLEQIGALADVGAIPQGSQQKEEQSQEQELDKRLAGLRN